MVPEHSDEASGSAALASLILHLFFDLVNQQSSNKSKHKTGATKQTDREKGGSRKPAGCS